MLEVTNLQTYYGSIAALKGVNLKVEAGSVVALVGANGAGKSTTLNSISGVVRPREGKIIFKGQDITGWRADSVTALGAIQVPEGRQVLAPLTVEENLLLGAYKRKDSRIKSDLQATFDRFPRLLERRNQFAGLLSGGEQQMLAIGRAIMARPQLLMMDEPSLGLAPLIVQEVFDIIADLKQQGSTILLVEQNARKALQIADYAFVLESGKVVKQGLAKDLQGDSSIVEAYLGKK
jgi:branched-chain amino acid transport system ATP-binding protein